MWLCSPAGLIQMFHLLLGLRNCAYKGQYNKGFLSLPSKNHLQRAPLDLAMPLSEEGIRPGE